MFLCLYNSDVSPNTCLCSCQRNVVSGAAVDSSAGESSPQQSQYFILKHENIYLCLLRFTSSAHCLKKCLNYVEDGKTSAANI